MAPEDVELTTQTRQTTNKTTPETSHVLVTESSDSHTSNSQKMNLQNEGDPSSLLFVNFNQDASSLAVGTKRGYQLFTFKDPTKLEKIHEENSEDICVVERLFSSSLVALVSLSSPRKLKVCHFKRNTEICNYTYSNTILAVKLNRQRLVVCLEESLFIHNIRDMKLLHTIRETPANPLGLCALSSSNENCFLAYPGHNTVGEVQIFDTDKLVDKITFAAHDNPLAALAFDNQGTRLATASEKGTVIRVHDVLNGNCTHEFRRGFARCVTIYSLCFSSDSQFLSASSNTETVHIFKLEEQSDNKINQEASTWFESLKDTVVQMGSLLPSVNQVMNQWRCFAHARLPFNGLKNVCALSMERNSHVPQVLVASADGFFYIYDINVNEGGECTLIKQHRLDGSDAINDPESCCSTAACLNYAAALRGLDPSTPPCSASPPSPTPATRTEEAAFDGDFPPISEKAAFQS